jgi:hypothetical protein
MPNTPRLGIPLIASGQTQKDITHNEAILALDRIVALGVVSRSVTAPPSSVQSGSVYIVPASEGEAWGQPPGTMMQWQGSGWLAVAARAGQLALVVDEGIVLMFRQDWQSFWPVKGLEVAGRAVLGATPTNIPLPSGGSTMDTQARAAIAAIVSLLVQQGIASA